MHVAQFVHRYPPALGGAEAYTARLSEHLVRAGDDVTVWTTTAVELEQLWSQARRYSRRDEADRPGLAVRRYHPLHFPARRYLLKAMSVPPVRLWQCLIAPCNPICPTMWRDAGRYAGPLDSVHATAFPYSFPIVCGLRLARRRGVPFFITPFLHLGDPENPSDCTRRQYTAPHLKWLLNQADGVFVQTRTERAAVTGLGISETRVHLQGLGVDTSECIGGSRAAARFRWGIRSEEVVIGHLANKSQEKGTVALLQAAEQLWSRGERFRVVLAGPEMPNYRAFWKHFGPKHGVTNLGVLGTQHKRDFFAAIDAFVLPSRTDSFGLVLLEAWANSKPNLVYRAGGPAEIIRDGVDGLHARCGDMEELTMQLSRLVNHEELRRSLGEQGRSRIEREFRWDDKLELARRIMNPASRAMPDAGTGLVGCSIRQRAVGEHAAF